ncbi:MAG: molybdopterin cofactor-binding domain-containing protein, partial [Burkholderiaceae bacterium]
MTLHTPVHPGRRHFMLGAGALVVSFAIPVTARRARAASGPAVDAGSQLVPKDKVDSFIALLDDGSVVASNGHVDLGTGLRTAYCQIVAEELDVELSRVSMVMGDTDRTPNQGPTIASASIQTAAVPMRQAAAQARHFLLNRAAQQMNVAPDTLTIKDGTIHSSATGQRASYASLIQGQRFELTIDKDVVLKRPDQYTLVGKPIARVDIPAKVTGGLIYVHDMRVPGMVHARVVRPPYRGRDGGEMVGKSLESVDAESVRHIPGLIKVVVLGDFVAVVAEREENAIKAARELAVVWRSPPPLVDLRDLDAALRKNTDTLRALKDEGDVQTILASTPSAMEATYIWPYQMHGSIGPSCGLASFEGKKLVVWTGSQNPHNLHSDLATLLKMDEADIRVVRMEASGCYGRNCADDAAAEAALLAREIGRPVRVQLMREEEHAWEPKGTAQIMDVKGALTQDGTLAYDFVTRYPSNGSPLLALLYTGAESSDPNVFEMGDRTAIPQYRVPNARIVARDSPPIVRSSWIRGVAALPNVFAHESFIDELASRHQADPVEFRLRFMEEPRAIALVKAVAERAQWQPRPSPMKPSGDAPRARLLRGRGFSQHQYIHGKFPGVGAAWCAWAVEVEVDTQTGGVRVLRVVAGQDCGMMVNPAGVKHQVHGNVLQVTSRTLMEQVRFDANGVTSLEWGAYPILRFTDMPEIDVLLMPDAGNPPLGAGESASVPGPAAIANAIFDAAGIRLREAPFTPERVK